MKCIHYFTLSCKINIHFNVAASFIKKLHGVYSAKNGVDDGIGMIIMVHYLLRFQDIFHMYVWIQGA